MDESLCDPKPNELTLTLLERTSNSSKDQIVIRYEGTYINHRVHLVETFSGSEIERLCSDGPNHTTQFGVGCQADRVEWDQTYDLNFSVGWRLDVEERWELFDPSEQFFTIPIEGTVREGKIPCGAEFNTEPVGSISVGLVDGWNVALVAVDGNAGLVATVTGSGREVDLECGKTMYGDAYKGAILPRGVGALNESFD